MRTIESRNVNDALLLGMQLLRDGGEWKGSRGGKVIEYPECVSTTYEKPQERVLFDSARNANPFFHFIEGLWMLDGRNDVESIRQYVVRMETYSDDGETLHGAYGHRWRNHFVRDQLLEVVNRLQKDPEDRRVVLTMWDPIVDLGYDGKDFPCNTHIYFKVRNNKLLMTVCCRSNDMIWGAYGANAVHMSMLQEFVANALRIGMGSYTQVSDSFHAYKSVYEKLEERLPELDPYNKEGYLMDPYKQRKVVPYRRMVSVSHDSWLYQLNSFLKVVFQNTKTPFEIQDWKSDVSTSHLINTGLDPFFVNVAEPIAETWAWYSSFRETGSKLSFNTAIKAINRCTAADWRLACREWLERKV